MSCHVKQISQLAYHRRGRIRRAFVVSNITCRLLHFSLEFQMSVRVNQVSFDFLRRIWIVLHNLKAFLIVFLHISCSQYAIKPSFLQVSVLYVVLKTLVASQLNKTILHIKCIIHFSKYTKTLNMISKCFHGRCCLKKYSTSSVFAHCCNFVSKWKRFA